MERVAPTLTNQKQTIKINSEKWKTKTITNRVIESEEALKFRFQCNLFQRKAKIKN